ncbi:MAG TPA: hypothetical protein VMT57_09475 [Candidatus Thermoplasmatota archaeon]|nr:hypothetical protein [Candidatus Thermoplasmatota archaeon]
MTLGEKLWEGKGKSSGSSFIKAITMDGVTSVYSWNAQVKGVGKAKGADGNIHVTANGTMPPKGVASEDDLGTFMTMGGDMGVIKGFGLMKMTMGGKPSAVSLWGFMTMSERLGWMNDLIAVAEFEALDPMWMEFNVTIHEWK